jgi:ADP-ribosylglycohydrolase
MPSALYILMRHSHEPAEAIVRAVNDTWDNDTIGAIVGAAVGELHGAEALPKRWLEGLSGRTRLDGDGAMPRLLGTAERRWRR